MKRKCLVIGIILLFVGIIIQITTAYDVTDIDVINPQICPSSNMISNHTLYVDDNNTEGPWDGSIEHPYQHINDATRNATEGDIVFVFNGTYNEQVYMETTVRLVGESKYSTIIDGGGSQGSTVVCHANGITVTGFTIRRCGDWAGDAGVWITDAWSHHSSYNTITDNIICNNNHFGIMLYQSNYNIITNNIIANNSGGIDVGSYSTNNVFSGNSIVNNYFGLWGAPSSNIISDNYFEACGISIRMGHDNDIFGNHIKNGGDIILIETNSNRIYDNNFSHSKGIKIVSNDINQWKNHTITDNEIDGKPIYYYDKKVNGVIPSDASQVILVDCKYMTIENLSINGTYGIQLLASYNNWISKNIVMNCENPIKLMDSYYNQISFNEIKYGLGNGLEFQSSSSNQVFNNIVMDNKGRGIMISGSRDNTFSSNNIMNNTIGVQLDSSLSNKFLSNNFINNSQSHATFVADGLLDSHNIWKRNYWERKIPIGPKIIVGLFKSRIMIPSFTPGVPPSPLYLPTINIDLFPAIIPHMNNF
jgi:parallel beta-helix repeat protein